MSQLKLSQYGFNAVKVPQGDAAQPEETDINPTDSSESPSDSEEMADQESSSSVSGVPRSIKLKRKTLMKSEANVVKRRNSSSSSECSSSQKQRTSGIDPESILHGLQNSHGWKFVAVME